MADLDLRFTPTISIGSSVRVSADNLSRGDRALLITDSVHEDHADALQQQLDSQGIQAILYARDGLGCHSESLDEALSLARGSRSRMVVSLGGEKVLSLGRLVAAMAPSGRHALDALNDRRVEGLGLSLVELPSSGRHSLLFRKEAVLGERDEYRSALIRLEAPPGHTVILDSALSRNTPRGISVLSAAQRLGTAVESFLSPRSTILSDVQSRAAAALAVSLIRRVRDEWDDPDFRVTESDSLLLSAFAAGMTGVGPAQVLAWAVSWAAGLPRAETYAILLPWVLESPLYSGSPRAGELSRILAGEDGAAADSPAGEVRALFGRLGLPGRLRELGGDLADMIPAVSWAVAMPGGERSDFSETAFRDILEIAS